MARVWAEYNSALAFFRRDTGITAEILPIRFFRTMTVESGGPRT